MDVLLSKFKQDKVITISCLIIFFFHFIVVDMLDSFDLMQRFTMQAVMSAPFASDTFFLIRFVHAMTFLMNSRVLMIK